MKTYNIISWVIRLTISAILIQTLYFKFTAHPDSVLIFSKLNLEPFGRIGLGIIELITAVLILINSTKIIGLLSSLVIIMGAIFSHILILGFSISNDGGVLFSLAIIIYLANIIYLLVFHEEIVIFFRKFNRKKLSSKTLNLCILSLLCFSSCAQNPTLKQENEEKMTQTNSVNLSEKEWKEKLSKEQYYILRQKGTEKPFSGAFVFTKVKGIYHCGGCGEALFTDEMKFDSHCGWPSFDKEIAGGKIIQTEDNSLGVKRIEISCAKCGGHLGHIFDDGPTETGKRYCVNSGALSFEAQKETAAQSSIETITLAGGCFWCIEAVFEDLKGVTNVESGYANGNIKNPTYKDVCSGNTGFAEAVKITYNKSIISFEDLLEVFFTLHNPTTLNQQGADLGTQYRSGIYYQTEEQLLKSKKIITTLNQQKIFDKPIVTEVKSLENFYKAENYHQEYYELNKEEPYCKAVIRPKMDKLHKLFADKLKPE